MNENIEKMNAIIKQIKDTRRDMYYLNEDIFNKKQEKIFNDMLDMSEDLENLCRDFIWNS